ncbi:MAG: hypothetical protein Q4D91_14265 [Lautropia sp.]|nr:hypothetical protein [Lautropia sp.]
MTTEGSEQTTEKLPFRSASDVLQEVWALGSFDVDEIPEPEGVLDDVDLDMDTGFLPSGCEIASAFLSDFALTGETAGGNRQRLVR